MAEVITRFKLETTQYDSKLRDAAKSLDDYTKTAALAGNEFAKFTQKNVEAARAFGNISTSANNSKDKLKELVGAFNDVAKQYNALTKEQQQSDFGKALAESMTTLKGRIKDVKEEMNSTGGVMDMLASKFTINFDAMKIFNIGLQAAKVALDVAKDAFFASEATVDEWGRTIQSAETVYQGFLNAINNGDISGFLGKMDELVRAARAAYDEMDKLNTMKTIQAPGISRQQTENERLRMMIQTGRYIAPADGRKATMQNGQLLTPEQIKTIERMLQGGLTKMTDLVKNEVDQTGKAIGAYYNSLAKQNGMSLQEFKKGTSTWEEFSKKIKGYEEYKKWDREARAAFARQGGQGSVNFDKNNPYLEYKKWGTFRVDKMGENSYNELVGLIKQRDQQASQIYSTFAQSYRAMNRVEGTTLRSIMGGGGSGSGRSGGLSAIDTNFAEDSIMAQEKEVQRLTDLWKRAGADVKDEYKRQLDEAIAVLDTMKGKVQQIDINKIFPERGVYDGASQSFGQQIAQSINMAMAEAAQNADVQTLHTLMETQIKNGIEGVEIPADWIADQIFGEGIDIPDEYWVNLQEQINEKLRELNIEPIKIDFKTGNIEKINKEAKESTKEFYSAASAIQSVGSALNSIEDPAAKVMGIVSQAIATVALAFANSLKGSVTVWDYIAGAAAGLSTMISTISAIHSATGFAHGGIVDGRSGGFVGGNTFSGDNIGNVRLDAGELVLNRSQQSALASQLENSWPHNLQLDAIIEAEDIRLVLNNNGRRTGRGEYVQSKNRR